jgi:hypothetical protein
VGFYSQYARAVADSLHVEATGALRRDTAGLGVRARQADRRRRGECAHAMWRAGSPAETRPGGACGADAHQAHAQTPRTDRGTAVHGGDALATCGVAPERATSRRGALLGRSERCAPVCLHKSQKFTCKLHNW